MMPSFVMYSRSSQLSTGIFMNKRRSQRGLNLRTSQSATDRTMSQKIGPTIPASSHVMSRSLHP